MKVTTLFSGGKDSGLTAILLEPFFDEIELVTFSFGRDDAWKAAAKAAEALGHPHRVEILSEDILEAGLDMLVKDGYPNNALNYVHRCAIETLAESCEYIADGTRRDDRAPVMTTSIIRSLEDRHKMQYLRPLAGWGWRAINEMAKKYMEFEVLPSDRYPASDFEVGLRYALAERYGQGEVDRIFPASHTHSIVIRRKLV